MIDTLGTISERIIRDLSGGDIPSDSPYKIPFVAAHVREALRENLKLEILQRRAGREDDRTPITTYIATYPNVEVKTEQGTFRAYIDLPSSYMSLKHNKGIHAISAMNKPLKRMIPIANPGVTSNLPHASLEQDNYGYYVEGYKLFWMRNIIKDGISKVLVKLIVPAPDTWGIDDPLPVVPENVAAVIDTVKQRILNKTINDRLNDNNPNIRPQNV